MTVEGDPASIPRLDRLRIGLWPANESMNGGSQRSTFNAQGLATIDNVFPGEYRVWLSEGQSPDLLLKEATYDRTDALNGFAKVTSGTSTLNVVVSNKAGRIDGTLLDAVSKPVQGTQVVLIPDQFRHRHELYKMAQTDQDGHFTIRGIPPGNYKLFAWDSFEESSWFNPDVRAPYESQAKSIRIQEGSKETTS